MRGARYLLTLLLVCVGVNVVLLVSVDRSAVLPPQNYFVVANYYNSEESLQYSLPQLRLLIDRLELGGNVYLSVFENGSEDSTALILNEFARGLSISHTVITCNFSGSFIKEAASEEQETDFDLNRIIGRKRYLRMAALRNLAMRPLYTGAVTFRNPALPTKVIFLNDIYFTAEQIVDLLGTNEGEYDIACGLDFYDLFYDILVTRDLHGNWFSGFFPYSHSPESQQSIIAGKPLQVFSCWNGVAILRAEPFIEQNVRFRGRDYEGKCECVQSECLLVCRDFWDLGYSRVYINPAVRVTYQWKHFVLYNTPILSTLVQWAQFLIFLLTSHTPPSGIGCSMPPYWTGESATYMQLSQSQSCPLRFDEDRPLLNSTSRESAREHTFASRYESRLAQQCID